MPTKNAIQSDPTESIKSICKDIQSLIHELFRLHKTEGFYDAYLDCMQIHPLSEVLVETFHYLNSNPKNWVDLHSACLQYWDALFCEILKHESCSQPQSPVQKALNDKTFLHPAWQNSPIHALIKDSYHLTVQHALAWFNNRPESDNKIPKLQFYVKNLLSALSPTHIPWMNPEFLETTLNQWGENVWMGLKNYLEDQVNNKGYWNVKTTDLKAFSIGKNLATTPGKIIHQNDLMQLIQYAPATESVYQIPILFIPPWINKYYILDLSPENSLVRWLVHQGFTVYMISWVNPDAHLAHKQFEDYMLEGPIEALDVITKTARCPSVHMVGYCIGGTLLGCTLAYMKKTRNPRARSATYFMALLDFSSPGEMGVFIDEMQINRLDTLMEKKGYLDGRLLDTAFDMMRPNEIIWPYFVNHYLLGKPPSAHDLLYWNSDPTHLPSKMFSFYLHNMFLHNRLRQKNGIRLKNIPIDLKSITAPTFFLASENDHITPWKSVYLGTALQKSMCEFVLSASGHVGAILNAPSKMKHSYKINPAYGSKNTMPIDAEHWLKTATQQAGSWWPYWAAWLKKIDSETISARSLNGNPDLTLLEDAPGSYVLKRI